ncbi:MAG: sugar ABC transporter ATP-binding protein [Candidatus Leucobacter sulfamidivorax]|nr:sugar ABC transporter ATP-binding protein [Candidatus Leucobacter sulfamidivorax]
MAELFARHALGAVQEGRLHLGGGDTVGTRSSGPRRGIAYVPADRKSQALFGAMSAEENLLMPHYRRMARPLRQPGGERKIFTRIAERVSLHPADPVRPVEQFSGGNAQKISVGRWLVDQQRLRLLVLDEPTQGVDVGSRGELYSLLRDFTETGERAVLFATSDPDEVVALADRVLVLAHGRPVGIYPAAIGEGRLLSLAHSGESAEDTRAA